MADPPSGKLNTRTLLDYLEDAFESPIEDTLFGLMFLNEFLDVTGGAKEISIETLKDLVLRFDEVSETEAEISSEIRMIFLGYFGIEFYEWWEKQGE